MTPRPVPYGHDRDVWPYGLYLILSYFVAETLPARSLNCAYTVLEPAPLLSVQGTLVEKETHSAHVVVFSFLKRIEATPEAGEGSLADKPSVTERLDVEALPLFMEIVPLGTVVSTNQVRDAGLASTLPALSTVLASKVCLPWLRLE